MARISFHQECNFMFNCWREHPEHRNGAVRLRSAPQHEVKVAPHGNSLQTEGYVQTKSSILTSLKELSSESTTKWALSFVLSDAGVAVHAHSASSMPCSRQQVNNLRWKHSKSAEALYSLMLMCKEGKENKVAFVRIVNAAPYLMMLLGIWLDAWRPCSVLYSHRELQCVEYGPNL